MRTSCGLLLTAGLICGSANAAPAQSNDGLLPRVRNFFAPKSKADDGKAKSNDTPKEFITMPAASKRAIATNPSEGRGVVFVEEPARSESAPTVTTATPSRTTTASPTPASTTTQGFPITPQTNAPVTATKAPPPVSAGLAHKFTSQVTKACPQGRNVKVSFTGGNEVTVEMLVRSVDECNAIAGQIFSIRDLDPYRVNLKLQVPQ